MPRLQEEVQWMLKMTALEDFLLSISCYSPVKSPLAYVNKSEVLLVKDGYHVVVNINILGNRMTELLEGNIEKCEGRGSVTARDRCGGGRSIGISCKCC
jgi:hypothetical protein